MLLRFTGLVYKAIDYGESNEIVYVLTEKSGKMTMIARGSKKPRSRFRAVTEPFTLGEFICYRSSPSSIPTLSQAELLDANYELRMDLLKQAYASYWLEMMDKILPEGEANPYLYRLLTGAIDQLKLGKDPEILTRMIELYMLQLAGYRPVLNQCVQCRRKEGLVKFSLRWGGVLCDTCQAQDPHAMDIAPGTIHVLALLQRIPPDRLGQVRVKPETKEQMETLLHAFMEQQLEYTFKSKAILDQLRKDFS